MKELLTQFEKMTLALAKDGSVIKEEITPEQANLLHMAVGISGESGELLDAIKKHVIYQKPLDIENVKEELGDLLFYMVNLMQSVGLTFEEVLQHNVDKLSVRYSSGKYSNEQAQERADKVSELKWEKVMDRATYEAAFEILLALDECVDKAILQLEELEAITKASEKFVAEGGSMRTVLKGDMKYKLFNK